MLLDLVTGEGSVGDVLSYVTREVPGETGSLGQNKIKSEECAALIPETILKLR